MSNQLIVIGITGLARSGKDTIARILCTRFGFTRIALADGVRSAFRDLDGPTWELTKELEAAGKSPRWALQTLGTEARCDVAELGASSMPGKDLISNFWVHLLAAKMMFLHHYHQPERHRFVVPDVRFAREVLALSEITVGARGRYRTWKVTRDGSGLSGDASQHPSEAGVIAINPDTAICNNGSRVELETRVRNHAYHLLESSNGHRNASEATHGDLDSDVHGSIL